MGPAGDNPDMGVDAEDVGEEQQEVRRIKVPTEPTEKERAEHEEAGHVVHRNWCKICMAARATGQPHLEAPPEDETALPKNI